MKLVRYGPLGEELPGIIDEYGMIYDLSNLLPDFNSNTIQQINLQRLVELDLASLTKVGNVEEVRLGVCVANPGKLIGIGFNSRKHTQEMGFEPAENPIFFNKATSSLIGAYDPIYYPKNAQKVDWEAELAVVIGKHCKNVSEDEALDYIFGYTCCNDLSDRYWQFEVSSQPQHTLAKSFDTFGPLGPYIVTPDEAGDISHLRLQLWVNDQLRQDFYSDDYTFNPAQVISYLSKLFTLQAGDIITLGTGPGIAKTWNNQYLKPGDKLRLQIEKIGEQQQIILAEDPKSAI